MIGFDVISYLDDKDIEYRQSGKNVGSGWVGIKCIFCGDNSFHLGINLEAATYSCFRCSAKGHIVSFIAEVEHCSKKQAYVRAQKYLDLNLTVNKKKQVTTYAEEVNISCLTKKFPDTAIQYLTNRNFDAQQIIRRYDLYWGGFIGDFKHRIVAPVYLDKKIVSLIGRDITGKSELRYKTLAVSKSKMSIKSTLYNIDSVNRDVIVVEGIFDCWRIGDSCVATMGTKFTAEQVLQFRGLRNVHILFDADARNQAEKLSAALQGLVEHVEIIALDKGDPAEMREWEVRLLRKELRI